MKAKHSQGSKCKICHRSFKDDRQLRQHLVTHDKEREFKCTINGCKKSYHTLNRLKIHERTHTGEKPFECEICQMKFTEKGGLKTHMNIHNEHKPYKCS